MKIAQALLLMLSPLVEAARGEPLVDPFVELHEEDEQRLRLRLRSAQGDFVFDRERRVLACKVVSLSR